jgi:hypothetical protein
MGLIGQLGYLGQMGSKGRTFPIERRENEGDAWSTISQLRSESRSGTTGRWGSSEGHDFLESPLQGDAREVAGRRAANEPAERGRPRPQLHRLTPLRPLCNLFRTPRSHSLLPWPGWAAYFHGNPLGVQSEWKEVLNLKDCRFCHRRRRSTRGKCYSLPLRPKNSGWDPASRCSYVRQSNVSILIWGLR